MSTASSLSGPASFPPASLLQLRNCLLSPRHQIHIYIYIYIYNVYVCARIHGPVCALCILRGAVVLTGDKDSGGECVTAGAGYSGRRSGKWCFEVEVVLGKGNAFAGMAGTDFRGNTLGEHPTSWAVHNDGDTYHSAQGSAQHCIESRPRAGKVTIAFARRLSLCDGQPGPVRQAN
jgi:hypothetical protein